MKTYLASTDGTVDYEVKKTYDCVKVLRFGEAWTPKGRDKITCAVKSIGDDFVLVFSKSQVAIDASELYELYLALCVHFENDPPVSWYRKVKS